MINRVSAIFEVDLKDFRDALDSMEIYSTYTYEKDDIRGSDIFYKISLESLRAVREMMDLIAHELNL